MTETKYKQLINKIFWFSLPIIIGFFSWITVMIYGINTEVQVQKKEASERKDLQEKIYDRVEKNYTILESKADEIENKKAHEQLNNKLYIIEKKVDKIYRNTNYTYKPTMNFIPYKEAAICSNKE